ncbi:hypothetical protein LX36DRAFT_453451 [Colletotrichum falcatum]|nr:hypothetical protein LX36DRAFT_453451 [Colletotrichum falcatum]
MTNSLLSWEGQTEDGRGSIRCRRLALSVSTPGEGAAALARPPHLLSIWPHGIGLVIAGQTSTYIYIYMYISSRAGMLWPSLLSPAGLPPPPPGNLEGLEADALMVWSAEGTADTISCARRLPGERCALVRFFVISHSPYFT